MALEDYEDEELTLAAERPAALQRGRAASLRRPQPLISTPSTGIETPPPQPGASPATQASEYRGKALSLLEQASQARPEETDLSALREFAKSRDEEANRRLMLGIALQAQGGESLAPVGSHLLRQSLSAQEPLKFAGGVIERGQFVADPQAAAQSRASRLEAQARLYEAMASHSDTVAQREAAASAADRTRREIAQLRADTAPKRHLQRAGTTPSGELVTFDPGSGEQLVRGKPYTGPVMSQATLDKQATAVQEALSSGNRLRNLDQMVAANPNAFGGVATLSQLTPQVIASRWQSAKLTPQEREVRALVMQEAAQVINDLYGAAVSAGEMGRANTFVPTGLDDPATVAVKLKAAQAWAASKAATYGQHVRGAAEARSGAPRAGPPPGAVKRID